MSGDATARVAETPKKDVILHVATTTPRQTISVVARKGRIDATPGRFIKICGTPVTDMRTPARNFRVHKRRCEPITPGGYFGTPFTPEAVENSSGAAECLPRATVPRQLFAATPAPKIRVANGVGRTQPISRGVGSPSGPLSKRLQAALDEVDENKEILMRRRATYVESFAVIPLHCTRVSFVARCCTYVPETKLRVLVDLSGGIALLRSKGDAHKPRNDAVLWKDILVDHCYAPLQFVTFLLDEAEARDLLCGGRPDVSRKRVLLLRR